MTHAGRDDRQGAEGTGYDYRRDFGVGFDDAVVSVERAIARHGFSVRVMHDIQATLAAKGFAIRPIRIYELDGPEDPASPPRRGGRRSDPRLARLMPCRINIFAEGDHVVVTALRPTLLCRVFPEDDLTDVATALERVLVAVVDEAVSAPS